MKLSIKDILSFCIDRGLRQFHLACKWGIAENADVIPDSAKAKIKEKKEDFFSLFNYYIVLKGDVSDLGKISNLVAKSLTGTGPQAENEGFVQLAGDDVAVAGIKIE